MSWITDLFLTNTNNTQTGSQQADNIASLEAQLAAKGKSSSGGYLDPDSAASGQLLSSLTGGVLGSADPNAAESDSGTGFGAVFKDVLILGAIAGAIYLFVKLGGIDKLKKLAS